MFSCYDIFCDIFKKGSQRSKLAYYIYLYIYTQYIYHIYIYIYIYIW